MMIIPVEQDSFFAEKLDLTSLRKQIRRGIKQMNMRHLIAQLLEQWLVGLLTFFILFLGQTGERPAAPVMECYRLGHMHLKNGHLQYHRHLHTQLWRQPLRLLGLHASG